MHEFVIHSSVDDCTIVFYDREPTERASPMDHFRVRITRSDLSAAGMVWAADPCPSPAPWLHDLAAHWHGWQGERIWESFEHEMKLIATNDRRGHITIRITLKAGLMERDWCLEAYVVVDAGQLEGLARQADRFFGTGTA